MWAALQLEIRDVGARRGVSDSSLLSGRDGKLDH